jgi:hypothetical protein
MTPVLATVGVPPDDGDRAAVHEDLARRIAADHDRVVGAITGHRQHAVAERRGGCRARRHGRTGNDTGGECGGGE